MKRTFGKLITLLLCLTMILSLIPVTALAAPTLDDITDNLPSLEEIGKLPELAATPTPADPTGACGVSMHWHLSLSTGVLTISGNGAMYDWSGSEHAPWYANRGKIKTVVIEPGVANIGAYAFDGLTNMTAIEMPATIERIGAYAFADCSKLTDIHLSDSIIEIGIGAFENCAALTKVTLPANIHKAADSLFKGCTALTEVIFPVGETELGAYAFEGCTALETVVWHDLTKIGTKAFSGCTKKTLINFPDTLTEIGKDAFSGSGLKLVKLPKGIPDIAFLGGADELTTVFIPKSVKDIEIGQFANCKNLKQIDYEGSKLDWKNIRIEANNEMLQNAEFTYNRTDSFLYAEGITDPVVTVTPEPTTAPTPTVEPTVTPEPTTAPTPTVAPTNKPDVTPNVTPGVDPTPTAKPTPTVTPTPTPYVPVEPTVNPELDPETCKHTLFFVAPQDATCTEDGFTGKVICGKGCGYVLQEGRVKPALGHKFKNGSCTRCGHIEGTPDPTPTPPTAGDTPFIDMTENDWFYEPVRWAVQNGITGGTSENTFSPNMTCTRAQIVTFLWAAAGKPEPTSKSPFSDVKEGDWFYKPVIWAVENDITSGTTATTFSPNIPCSRAQVVALLYKAMQSPAIENLDNPFTDVLESNYFHKAVMWALENGVASGITAELFGSSQPCTRAQIAMFLYKAYN